MKKGFFITGTDTDVGKTYVASKIIRAFSDNKCKVSGFKPVASGSVRIKGDLKNNDALSLINEASVSLPYKTVNPYCFEPPIAPHIAADQMGVEIELSTIQRCYMAHETASDVVIVEGAGGWKVPLGPQLSFDDVALALNLPVILVVGLQLGCINHALLSEAAILTKGCRIVGWVGNQIKSNFSEADENLATLKERMESPCIGYFDYQSVAENNELLLQANMNEMLNFLKNSS